MSPKHRVAGKRGGSPNKDLSATISAAPFVPTGSSPPKQPLQSTPQGSKSVAAFSSPAKQPSSGSNDAAASTPANAAVVKSPKPNSFRAEAIRAAPFVPNVNTTTSSNTAVTAIESAGSETSSTFAQRIHAAPFVPGAAQTPSPSKPLPSPPQYCRATPSPQSNSQPSSAQSDTSRAYIHRHGMLVHHPSPQKQGRGRGGRHDDAGGRGRGRRGQPPQYAQYQGPHERNLPYFVRAGKLQAAAQFMSARLRAELQQRNFLVHAQWQPDLNANAALPLPEMIKSFHSLWPLEDMAAAEEHMSTALGVRSVVLKAINSVDGTPYALRRIDGKQVIPTGELLSSAQQAVEKWSVVADHPNLVGLRSVFVSDELDSTNALFFVYDYHPGALTLEAAHLQPSAARGGALVQCPPAEDALWSYMLQLTAAVRAVHSAGLVLRPNLLMPSKILVTSMGRLRIGSIGLFDALRPDIMDRDDIMLLQREDLKALGTLLLTLACSGSGALPSLEYCAARNSMELVKIIQALLSSSDGTGFASWRPLCAVLHERALTELDNCHNMNDAIVHEMAKEVENGRLLRLLVKLAVVNERPEHAMDTHWSDTGDRYVLKLFRDFVFHQCNEDGSPIVDFGLIVEALNKLDAGVAEKILLLSRDEQSMLVVSYADVKRCLEGAYNEIATAAFNASRHKRVWQ